MEKKNIKNSSERKKYDNESSDRKAGSGRASKLSEGKKAGKPGESAERSTGKAVKYQSGKAAGSPVGKAVKYQPEKPAERPTRKNVKYQSEKPAEHPVGKTAKCPAGRSSGCPAASKCGGCRYQGVDYSEQLNSKRGYAGKLLGKFGHIEPVIGMNGEGERPEYYRNKVHHVIDRDRKNNVISGIYQEGTHKVVPVRECMLEDRQCQKIIDTVCQLAVDFKIRIYDEDTGYGLIRHVLVRKGFETGQIMVVIVIASKIFPSKSNFVKALIDRHPEISTVVFNINNRSDSMVLGDRSETAYGKGYIEDRLLGLTFRISPDSFYQINSVQTEKLYRTAISYAAMDDGNRENSAANGLQEKKPVIIDAYCGIGTIGLCAAAFYGNAEVIGIELNGNAVKDARTNAQLNGISNAKFYKGDAGDFMEKMAAAGEHADVVFMDPPRAGSDSRFIKSLLTLNPEKIVYISCNPQTQARDLILLTAGRYKVKKIQPVDMFPYTEHVETVVLLSKR